MNETLQPEINRSEIPNNSDTISRQAAINIAKELTITVEGYEMHNQAVMNYCAEIMQLPSVQPEPESISKWKKEFREYVDSLDIARDDWKGIIEYIDELPSAEPDTTTHGPIPVKNGRNDEDRTSGDCISRAQAIDVLHGYFDGMLETDTVCPADIYGLFECMPSAQPELDIWNDGTLHISVSKGQLDKIGRVLVEEDGTIFCKLFYQDADER